MPGQTSTRQTLAIAASVAIHCALTLGPSWAKAPSVMTSQAIVGPPPLAAESTPIGLELPSVAEGLSLEEQPPVAVGAPPPPPTGDAVAHPETDAAGRGGDVSSKQAALNLADEDDKMRLSPDLLSRLDRDQVQRLKARRSRASWEDRRSTTNPAELTLVAVGSGTVHERREHADAVPARGVLASPLANVLGSALGSDAQPESAAEGPVAGADLEGASSQAPGAGLREGRPGADHRASAPVASARPSITRGPVAVLATDRAMPQDDLDSQQEVATTIRSIVHASTAGGLMGEGAGGSGGPGDPGAGGDARDGLRPRVLGLHDGSVYDYFTSDPRFVAYFRSIHAKIDPLLNRAFPRSAMLDLQQGTVILEFTVLADGRVEVQWPPARPSGIDEFDRNCAAAIRRAAPFSPIPSSLGSSLRIRAPFVAINPIVR